MRTGAKLFHTGGKVEGGGNVLTANKVAINKGLHRVRGNFFRARSKKERTDPCVGLEFVGTGAVFEVLQCGRQLWVTCAAVYLLGTHMNDEWALNPKSACQRERECPYTT